jgi:ribosomal protein S18 acetylase RimI-like enzyme
VTDLVIREAGHGDRDELFSLYSLVVQEGGAFPTAPPAGEDDFENAWWAGSAVFVACLGDELAGSYYLRANFGGRASHIGNAGYMVQRDLRRQGIGRRLVEHSLITAPAGGFDALMFNLVFASNPARKLYEDLGFEAVGRVPEAVDGEDALVYWRRV